MSDREYGVQFPDEPVIGGFNTRDEAAVMAEELKVSPDETFVIVARDAMPWEEVQDAPAVP